MTRVLASTPQVPVAPANTSAADRPTPTGSLELRWGFALRPDGSFELTSRWVRTPTGPANRRAD
jgi:hypothetical protein